MLLIVSVFLAGLLQSICLVVGVSWVIGREKRRFAVRLDEIQHEWFDHAEGEPHKAAQVLDASGAVVGSAAARSIMASLNAEKSHVARVAGGMADELQSQQNPLLGLLAGGKRGKGAAVMQLAQLLGPVLMGGSHNGNGTGSSGSEYTGRKHRE